MAYRATSLSTTSSGVIIGEMMKLAALVVALATSAGCYATGYGYAGGSTSYGSTTGYVTYAAPAPVEVDVDLYHEPRSGYVWVNGHYEWYGNQWVWQNGYYEAERPGYVYVQPYWYGNQFYRGGWTAHRQGYVYTDGYWDRRGRGHVWVNGSWQRDRNDSVWVNGRWSTNGGTRSYQRGGWQPRGGVIRDHRR